MVRQYGGTTGERRTTHSSSPEQQQPAQGSINQSKHGQQTPCSTRRHLRQGGRSWRRGLHYGSSSSSSRQGGGPGAHLKYWSAQVQPLPWKFQGSTSTSADPLGMKKAKLLPEPWVLTWGVGV